MSSTPEKRTVPLSLRMTPNQWETIAKAGEILWPGAMLSKSATVLGIALKCAEDVVARKRKRRDGGG